MLDLDCLLNVAKDAAKLAGDHLNENKQKNEMTSFRMTT